MTRWGRIASSKLPKLRAAIWALRLANEAGLRHDGLMSKRRNRSSTRWLMVTWLVGIIAAAGLAVGVWFFSRRGLTQGAQWAEIVAACLAYVVAVTSLLWWMSRRALDEERRSQPRNVFNVTAGRDAYNAEQQTFYQHKAPRSAAHKEPGSTNGPQTKRDNA